jgi:hypothetical protein
VVLLTVHPSTSLPKFGISEWLAAFSFVISYFHLSLGRGSRNCNTEELQIAWTLNVMLVKNIKFFQHESSTKFFFASVFHIGL